jgi:dihydroorotate dehydrogenase (NAD+) catalytic subunit
VWVKLTPAVTDIGVIARAVEAVGADALTCINTLVGMSIDLHSFKPRLSFRTGGLSGPAIRPVAVHLAHQAARAVSIPVVGVGGISSADDALEFLVAGCRAVQVGTATFADPTAIAKVHDGITQFCVSRGYASVAEIPRYLPRD